jgi:hypothetical protein
MTKFTFGKITPCSPLKVNRRFEETYRFYLQGRAPKHRLTLNRLSDNNQGCEALKPYTTDPFIHVPLHESWEQFHSADINIVALYAVCNFFPSAARLCACAPLVSGLLPVNGSSCLHCHTKPLG